MKRKNKLGEYFARCPHCSTLYALYRHIDMQKLATAACGSCGNSFIVRHHLTEPTKKIVIPNENSTFATRLSKIKPNTYQFITKSKGNRLRWVWASGIAGVFLVVNLSVGTFAWYYQAKMVSLPEILIEQHKLVSYPDGNGGMQLQASIKNESNSLLPLKNLEMQIQDLEGKPIETLVFTPAEYAASIGHTSLAPHESAQILVTLRQPLPDLFSYEINFI